MIRLFPLLSCAALLGCPDGNTTPGDENMGTYQFRAEPLSFACGLADISNSAFEFTGTYSRFRDGGGTFLTLGDISRDAGFDGQVVRSSHAAARSFTLPDAGTCAPCEMRVVETIEAALLSKSQSSAVGDKCPTDPLDGGLPGPDAGVQLPGTTPTGFDAVRACGAVSERIEGTGTCDPLCACLITFRLTGERK